jgi:uncharacterized repeat protein (TIGR03837 family)
MTRRAVILCKVIDNFGDAGVCWRLARQLMFEYAWQVVVVCDQPEVISRIGGQAARVVTRAWDDAASHGPNALFDGAAPDLVIAAFACDLPERWRDAFAKPGAPAWVNLEYLSAESWIEQHHGLVSLKPDGARELFFFPGYTTGSGGLIREAGLIERLDSERLNSWQLEQHKGYRLSLFCYPGSALQAWIQALELDAAADLNLTCLVAQGVTIQTSQGTLADTAGATLPTAGTTWQRLPWLDHEAFDQMLATCDFNIVRGEDSWVRAQWAGRAFAWQPYPQSEAAHQLKSQAFSARVAPHLPAESPWCGLMEHWSGAAPKSPLELVGLLPRMLDPAMRSGFKAWRTELAAQEPLVTRLLAATRLL